jgi:hypothetical protein
MFRYKLRTLISLLALVPPVMATVAWLAGFGVAGPIALAVAVYVCLAGVLVVTSRIMEATAPHRPRGTCSFCGVARRPLAEGPNEILICRECAGNCIALIDDELARQNQSESLPRADPGFKTAQPFDRVTE